MNDGIAEDGVLLLFDVLFVPLLLLDLLGVLGLLSFATDDDNRDGSDSLFGGVIGMGLVGVEVNAVVPKSSISTFDTLGIVEDAQLPSSTFVVLLSFIVSLLSLEVIVTLPLLLLFGLSPPPPLLSTEIGIFYNMKYYLIEVPITSQSLLLQQYKSHTNLCIQRR